MISKQKEPIILKDYIKPWTTLSSPILIDNAVSGFEESANGEDGDVQNKSKFLIDKHARMTDVVTSSSSRENVISKNNWSRSRGCKNMPNFTFNFCA